MMTRNGLLVAALPALVMGAIAVAMLMSVGDDDSTSSSVVTNSLDTLHQFTDPYSAHMTGLAADDVVPEDFGARLGPLKKDFDLGVEEWMSRYDSWSLPDETGTGLPTHVSVIAFNNALVDWTNTHKAYHRVLEGCAGEVEFAGCADSTEADEAWSEGLDHLEVAEEEMLASVRNG